MTNNTYVTTKRVEALQWDGTLSRGVEIEKLTGYRRFRMNGWNVPTSALLHMARTNTWTSMEIGDWVVQADVGFVVVPESVFQENYRKDEPEQPSQPVAENRQLERHAEKQGCSWSDAWSYFEAQGYDMSNVDPQY